MKKVTIGLVALLMICITDAQEIKKIKVTDLEKTIAESKTPLIVNFWATFCKPCIKTFATKHKFTVPIVWLDETNADYFCPKVDPKWSGAIPATLFINNATGYRKFFEEQLSLEKLQKEIMAILGKTD